MSKHIHAAGTIFQDVDGYILLLLRHADGDEGGTWGLAGGKLDAGETSLHAAKREVQEETGLEIDPKKLSIIKTYTWDREDHTVTFDVYMCKLDARPQNIELRQEENVRYDWFLPKDAYVRTDLMQGLYPILKDHYKL